MRMEARSTYRRAQSIHEEEERRKENRRRFGGGGGNPWPGDLPGHGNVADIG